MKKLTFILSITLTLSAFGQVPSYVPTNGLVGWWPFNGNANDASGNGNNGVMNGPVLTTDRFGNPNSAYNITTGQTILIPNNPSIQFSTQYSISIWVYPYSNGLTLIRKDYDYGLDFSNSNNTGSGLYVISFPSNLFSTSQILANQWTHIVATKNGSSKKLYFNGVLSAQANNGVNLAITASPLTIGSWSNETINAIYDDIGIWNRALTPQEVAALYNGCQQSILTQPQSQTASFNDNVQFTAASSDQSATYQWQTNMGVGFQNLSDAGQYSGSSTNTLNVSNVTLSNNNQQFRCIIASGSCMDTSDVALLSVVDNVGLAEQNQMQLLVYPNPASSIITIENPQGLISNFVVVDAQGREVHSGTLNTATTLDLHAFPTGMYTILFENKALQDVKISKE